MDKKINQWLQTFSIFQDIALTEDIHTERLTDSVKNLALQRTGVQELDVDYVGEKGWKRQYQYMLLLKSESEIDKQRILNLDWLDDLCDLLDQANKSGNYPTLTNREVVNVSCANGITYQESDDGAITIYSLQLYFDIKGGN